MKVAVPVLETEVNGRRLVNAHFGKSNLFAVADLDSGEIEIFENPALHLERGRGVYIAQSFYDRGVEAVLVKEMGPGAFDKVRNRFGMKVYLIPSKVKFLDEALTLFKEGKLQELLEPNEEEGKH